MKLIQFAVASIVDANTGNGLINNYSRSEAAFDGQSIRAPRSGLSLSLPASVTKLIDAWRERAANRHQLRELTRLNDQQLRDIGLNRGDVVAVELGQISLRELHEGRLQRSRHKQFAPTQSASVTKLEVPQDAANDLGHDKARCA